MVPTRKTPIGIDARRILIYGVTGSGKSTLADQVSKGLGLPLFLVDELTWEPNWVEKPLDQQRMLIAEICAAEEWVLDSAYGKWLDIPLDRVELILGLDLPRWVSLGRLLRRTARRIVSKETCCNGNRETLGKVLSRDSILAWHFKSFARKRARIADWEARMEGVQVLRFTTTREVKIWLASLSKRSRP